nr:Peptide (Neuropeptide FF/F/Y-like) G protein-coupled receptor [Hymenolepis microstoma]
MKDIPHYLPEILPDLQNGSAFAHEILHSIYGNSYFSSHRIAWVRIILIVLYTLFAIIGVTTNTAVVFFLLIWHPKSLRNITNRFVLALAISDIIMSGFNMPMQAYYEMEEHVFFSDIACRLIFSTFGLPMHISCLVILVIGIDRYRIIVYPLQRRMPRGAASLLLVGICVISVVSVIPIAVFNKSMQPEFNNVKKIPMNHHYCVEDWPSEKIRLSYSVFTFTVQFFLPLLLTAILYTRIYFRLHERRFRKRDLERKKRTNKILIAIVICFFICWTPWNVFSIILEVHAYRNPKRPFTLFPFDVNDDGNIGKMMDLQYLLSPQLNKLLFYHGGSNSSNRIPRSFSGQYNISEFVPQSDILLGGHAKLIDLILKLLAMCSGCLNPCLYGCMTDTMRLLMKRMAARFQRMRHNGQTRLRGSFRGLPEIYTSDRSLLKTKPSCKYQKATFGKVLYNIHCCGFQFIVRTAFHRHEEQVRNMLDGKRKSESSEPKTTSSIKRAHRLQRCSTNDKIPPYASGDQEPIAGDQKFASSQSAQSMMCIQQLNYNLQRLDPESISFLHRESGTLSIIESSTKRTSLLPSSFYDKTPRSSFLVDGSKPPDGAAQVFSKEQPVLRIPKIAPVVTIREADSAGELVPCTADNPKPQQTSINRNQKLVNIEVYSPPPCTCSPPRDSICRRSSSLGAPKAGRTLAPLEEVSIGGTLGESTASQQEDGIMSGILLTTPVANTSNESTETKRNLYKRSVSISCDKETSRFPSSVSKRRSFQLRRQSAYEALKVKKSPTLSIKSKASLAPPKDGSTESESAVSDDFAHFHKIVLQDERLKANLASKKPRKSYSTITALGTTATESQPRKPIFYSVRFHRAGTSTKSITSLSKIKVKINNDVMIT